MSGPIGNNPYRASGIVATAAAGLEWCSSIKTSAFCAEAGKGYFVDTCTCGAVTTTLPATASVGDEINFTDYARTWATANLTICQNSLKYQGNATPTPIYDTDGATVRIVYSGATKGWIPQLDKDVSFETPQTYNVQYLVVAGGGGAGVNTGGGGGGGGMRVVATKSFEVTGGDSYTVTVGGGGAGAPNTGTTCPGTTSVFSTITSAGGGGGGTNSGAIAGQDGGSGGGAAGGTPSGTGGSGNTPAIPSPLGGPQGNDGGPGCGGTAPRRAGGGGGHSCAGQAGPAASATTGGAGGDGTVNGIRGTPFDPVAYAGGGGGAQCTCGGSGAGGAGGAGGGGQASGGPSPPGGVAGTANSGGGGGGGGGFASGPEATPGGSGIVILRRVTACSCSSSGTVTTCGTDTIHTFLATGTFTA